MTEAENADRALHRLRLHDVERRGATHLMPGDDAEIVAKHIRALEAENAELLKAVWAYRDGYHARGRLLVCYRLAKTPSERLFTQLDESSDAIDALPDHLQAALEAVTSDE